MKKTTPILMALTGLFALGCQKAERPTLKTHTIERKTIVARVEAAGKVVSPLDVEIKCKASGLIVSLPFGLGDRIRKGDLLLKLDPVDEERKVESARARLRLATIQKDQAELALQIAESDLKLKTREYNKSLDAAKARYQELNRTRERTERLYQEKLASDTEKEAAVARALEAASSLAQAEARVAGLDLEKLQLDSTRLNVQSRIEDVNQRQLELEIAEQALADTEVRAPMDGIVSSLPVQEGQIISSGISNVGGGTTIMTLSDFSSLVIRAQVDESSVGHLSPGQTAAFQVDAWPWKEFAGSVERISPRGEVSQNVVFFQVDVAVKEEGKELLRPEMSASVTIHSARAENALCLPWDALQQHEGSPAVRLASGEDRKENNPEARGKGKNRGKESWRKVLPGISDGTCIQILSGLKEGESIVIPQSVSSQWNRSGGRRGASIRL